MRNRMPKVGDVVTCPPDRGDASYTGRIEHVDPTRYDSNGTPYVWATVRRSTDARSAHVWPSHRIGYQLPKEA